MELSFELRVLRISILYVSVPLESKQKHNE